MSQTEKPGWVSQFNIDDAMWATLLAQADRQKSTPLAVALDMGLLNENKLLDCERERSNMASLKGIFFNGPAPTHLWASMDLAKMKRAGCIAVGEWENTIYIAKLSADPTGIELEYPGAIWLLGPWTGIKRWFAQWETLVAKLSGAPGVAPFSSSGPTKSTNIISSENSFSGMTVAPPLPENKAPALDVPAGLSLEGMGLETKPELPPVPSAPKENAIDAPLGLFMPASTGPEKTVVPEGQATAAFDFSNLTVTNATNLPTATITQTQTKTQTATIQSPPPTPPPMPPRTPAANVTAIHMTPPPPPISNDALTSQLLACPNQDLLGQTLIAGWTSYFEKTMILLFQNNQLITWKQGGNWAAHLPMGTAIPLDTPSIFKIVVDTARPYHGYVSPGAINDGFFKQTNGGQYPEHVSIIPVVADGNVVAMLMGGCSKAQGLTLTLPKLEEHAGAFSAVLMRLMAPPAPAALAG